MLRRIITFTIVLGSGDWGFAKVKGERGKGKGERGKGKGKRRDLSFAQCPMPNVQSKIQNQYE
ncbi:hypothetical protein VF08_30070 [Nostoc linckia z8]|uniref:Uncharacterized protein n=1 Tax=Nostoc linckia z8 TaxID=1628746 RepID=A0A9Q5Z6T3_NOSLI|nr:hypothetical protein VF08_30070 [Nostoc linckia z8]